MTQQARRKADERVALAREQAARAAAEEATRRSAFLAEASKVLANSLEPAATMRGLARTSVPFLGDFAAVALVDAQGAVGRAEVAWRDAGGKLHEKHGAALAEAFDGLTRAVERAVAAGRAEELPGHAGGENGAARDAAPAPWWRGALGPALVLPLLARGRTLGVLALA